MSDSIEPDAEGVEDPLGPPGAAADRSRPDSAGDQTERDLSDEDLSGDFSSSSMEDLVADLERTTAERDDLRDRLARNQADFENSRKRLAKQSVDDAARATEALVERLLPVLDACDGAVLHGAKEVEPIFAALLGSLEKEGLNRVDPAGDAFDPTLHEAVMHEPAADEDDGTVVSDVMRPGYTWKGRVVRPAMVKVRG